MKSRHLPETDIANMAFRDKTTKINRLESWLKPRIMSGSYRPFRQTAGDSVNQQLPLFPEGQVLTPWDKLDELISSACKGDAELLAMNLPLAKSTHDFSSLHDLSAETTDVRSITLAAGHAYEFSLPLIMRYSGGVSVVFPDLRRTAGLSAMGRLVVYSVLHERFRVAFPEYDILRLDIWRYKNNEQREIELYRHSHERLFSYEELQADFTETYGLLVSLMEAKSRERRSDGHSGYGPLFG